MALAQYSVIPTPNAGAVKGKGSFMAARTKQDGYMAYCSSCRFDRLDVCALAVAPMFTFPSHYFSSVYF